MFEFKHPKYYKELRKRNRDLSELQQVKLERSVPQSDQAISLRESETSAGERAPGQGLKLQAATHDLAEATGLKPQASSTKPQASSAKLRKHQATSLKP